MQDTRFQIVNEDCLVKLATLPDNCVDLVVTDHPYNTTNLPFDQAKIDLDAWWTQIHRVSKPSAVQVCFAAGLFTVDLIQSNRKNFRYDLIWKKTQAVGFLSANQRPLRAHESILIFCRRYGRVKGMMQSCYNPQWEQGQPYYHRKRTQPCRHYSGGLNDTSYHNDGRRHPVSVLTFARDTPSVHPTQKPVDMLRWLIRAYSHPGETVLDTFAGSGSTGVAALLEGRCFIGMEMDADYHAIALQRIQATAGGQG